MEAKEPEAEFSYPGDAIVAKFRVDPALPAMYPSVAGAIRELLPRLTTEERAIVLTLVVRVCQSCYETMQPCRCWDDSLSSDAA